MKRCPFGGQEALHAWHLLGQQMQPKRRPRAQQKPRSPQHSQPSPPLLQGSICWCYLWAQQVKLHEQGMEQVKWLKETKPSPLAGVQGRVEALQASWKLGVILEMRSVPSQSPWRSQKLNFGHLMLGTAPPCTSWQPSPAPAIHKKAHGFTGIHLGTHTNATCSNTSLLQRWCYTQGKVKQEEITDSHLLKSNFWHAN